jgi:hypothetical protein
LPKLLQSLCLHVDLLEFVHRYQHQLTAIVIPKLPRTLRETGKVTEAQLDEVAEKALNDGSIIYNLHVDLLEFVHRYQHQLTAIVIHQFSGHLPAYYIQVP